MKEKYLTPELEIEELVKADVLCVSKQYNINGKFNEMFNKVSLEDLL
jgi:hypothetical protein